MDIDYYMNDGNSGENKPEGGSSLDAGNKITLVSEDTRPYKTNLYEFNVYYIFNFVIFIASMIYWYNVRPNWYKKIYKKLLLFQGFKYSHLTSQEIEA